MQTVVGLAQSFFHNTHPTYRFHEDQDKIATASQRLMVGEYKNYKSYEMLPGMMPKKGMKRRILYYSILYYISIKASNRKSQNTLTMQSSVGMQSLFGTTEAKPKKRIEIASLLALQHTRKG
jgi:hypothetical protein